MRDNTTLRQLGLAHNGLGDAGACAILSAVLQGGRLTALDLSSNGVSNTTLVAVASVLRGRGCRWLPATHPPSSDAAAAAATAAAADGTAASSRRSSCGDSPPGSGGGGGSGAGAASDAASLSLLCELPPWGPRDAAGWHLIVDLRLNCSLEKRAAAAMATATAAASAAAAAGGIEPGSSSSSSGGGVGGAGGGAGGPPVFDAYAALAPRQLPYDGEAAAAHLQAVQARARAMGVGLATAARSLAAETAAAAAAAAPAGGLAEPTPPGESASGSAASASSMCVDSGSGSSSGGGGGGGVGAARGDHHVDDDGGGNNGAQPPPLRSCRFDELRRQLGSLRHTTALCPYYMSRQVEINPSMRKILVEWLLELHEELSLPTEVAAARPKVAVLAVPQLATAGSSECARRLEAVLRSHEERPSTSDPTERPWLFRQRPRKLTISLRLVTPSRRCCCTASTTWTASSRPSLSPRRACSSSAPSR